MKVQSFIRKSGDYGTEDTPVPISNTAVKLSSADDTWREAAWESRTSPVFLVWLHGQAVKTSPFHGGNSSSILDGVTKKDKRTIVRLFFSFSLAKLQDFIYNTIVLWLYGQAVKTPPSHGGYPGSNPGRVTRPVNAGLYTTRIWWNWQTRRI